MNIVDMDTSQLSKPQIGSILTTRNSPGLDSKLRASSTSRVQDHSRFHRNDSKMRHSTVQPFNKSTYSKTQAGMDQPKTFFKGAVGFLQASLNGSLNDKNEGVKQILDEKIV